MTSRIHVDWVDLDDPLEMLMDEVSKSYHSHLLVCRGGFDEVVGVLPLRKVMQRVLANKSMPDIMPLLDKPIYIPDSMGVLKAVEKLQDKVNHLAVVVNEFGAVQGVLTLKDVFNGLILDLDQQQEGLDNIIERDDGSFLMEGTLPFAEFVSHFEVEEREDEELGGFHTLAGFFLNQFKQFPHTGDHLTWKGYRFEVIDMDGKRIDKLLVTPLTAQLEDQTEEV